MVTGMTCKTSHWTNVYFGVFWSNFYPVKKNLVILVCVAVTGNVSVLNLFSKNGNLISRPQELMHICNNIFIKQLQQVLQLLISGDQMFGVMIDTSVCLLPLNRCCSSFPLIIYLGEFHVHPNPENLPAASHLLTLVARNSLSSFSSLISK